MQNVTKEQWLASLHAGDIGIIHAHNFFATLQNLYRIKFNEGPMEASHGFYLREPPKIIEANGFHVSSSNIIKNIGDATECWIFRYADITPEQIAIMNAAADIAIEVGGEYSLGGIGQFGYNYIQRLLTGKVRHAKDENGVFCTEFSSRLILKGVLPYTKESPENCTPSYQLNWMSTYGVQLRWGLAAHYDGKGNYLVA